MSTARRFKAAVVGGTGHGVGEMIRRILIEGGAGQAIQNMSLFLVLDERLSLEDPGSWP